MENKKKKRKIKDGKGASGCKGRREVVVLLESQGSHC